MDRTEKKCFVGVTVMHALPLLIAIIGTAFFNKEEKTIEERSQVIEVINPIVTDGSTQGGAQAAITTEDVKLPEPASQKPAPPKPVPAEPQRVVEPPKLKPVEQKETVAEIPVQKPPKTLPKPAVVSRPTPKVAMKPVPTKPPRNIDISKPIVRNTTDKKDAAAAAEKAAKAAADRERSRISAQIKGATARLGQNLSSSTRVDLQGSSGDGAGAINYGDLVLKKYDDAWFAPNEIDDNEAIVKAKVVIARSGNVISADIIKASGNAVLDKSVRRALELRFIHAFPEGSKDSQRTYIINFNLKTKRGIG